jgi:hypothetical protein
MNLLQPIKNGLRSWVSTKAVQSRALNHLVQSRSWWTLLLAYTADLVPYYIRRVRADARDPLMLC